jgi:hypothetical protein
LTSRFTAHTNALGRNAFARQRGLDNFDAIERRVSLLELRGDLDDDRATPVLAVVTREPGRFQFGQSPTARRIPDKADIELGAIDDDGYRVPFGGIGQLGVGLIGKPAMVAPTDQQGEKSRDGSGQHDVARRRRSVKDVWHDAAHLVTP